MLLVIKKANTIKLLSIRMRYTITLGSVILSSMAILAAGNKPYVFDAPCGHECKPCKKPAYILFYGKGSEKSFQGAKEKCRAIHGELAKITSCNIGHISQHVQSVLGKNDIFWVESWNGDAYNGIPIAMGPSLHIGTRENIERAFVCQICGDTPLCDVDEGVCKNNHPRHKHHHRHDHHDKDSSVSSCSNTDENCHCHHPHRHHHHDRKPCHHEHKCPCDKRDPHCDCKHEHRCPCKHPHPHSSSDCPCHHHRLYRDDDQEVDVIFDNYGTPFRSRDKGRVYHAGNPGGPDKVFSTEPANAFDEVILSESKSASLIKENADN
jgi:hypothetical protein